MALATLSAEHFAQMNNVVNFDLMYDRLEWLYERCHLINSGHLLSTGELPENSFFAAKW